MGLEFFPGVLFEQLFPETDFSRAGKIHGLVPWNDAVAGWRTARGRRWTMRLAFAIRLPNSVGSVRMASRAIHHAHPEHPPRPFGRQAVSQHFVSRLAVNHRHHR